MLTRLIQLVLFGSSVICANKCTENADCRQCVVQSPQCVFISIDGDTKCLDEFHAANHNFDKSANSIKKCERRFPSSSTEIQSSSYEDEHQIPSTRYNELDMTAMTHFPSSSNVMRLTNEGLQPTDCVSYKMKLLTVTKNLTYNTTLTRTEISILPPTIATVIIETTVISHTPTTITTTAKITETSMAFITVTEISSKVHTITTTTTVNATMKDAFTKFITVFNTPSTELFIRTSKESCTSVNSIASQPFTSLTTTTKTHQITETRTSVITISETLTKLHAVTTTRTINTTIKTVMTDFVTIVVTHKEKLFITHTETENCPNIYPIPRPPQITEEYAIPIIPDRSGENFIIVNTNFNFTKNINQEDFPSVTSELLSKQKIPFAQVTEITDEYPVTVQLYSSELDTGAYDTSSFPSTVPTPDLLIKDSKVLSNLSSVVSEKNTPDPTWLTPETTPSVTTVSADENVLSRAMSKHPDGYGVASALIIIIIWYNL